MSFQFILLFIEKLYRDMKLQLNENTLTLYLSKAIKEELNENVLKESELRVMVDFNELGQAEKQSIVKKVEQEFGDAVKHAATDVLQFVGKTLGFSVNGEEYAGIKEQLRNGTFGKGDFGGMPLFGRMPLIGHIGQEDRTYRALIESLRKFGYTNKQIHDACQKSYDGGNKTGPIYFGTNLNGQFYPYEGNKAKRKWDHFMYDVVDPAIIEPEKYPEPDYKSEIEKAFEDALNAGSGVVQKGKDFFNDKFNGGLIKPDSLPRATEEDSKVNWNNIGKTPRNNGVNTPTQGTVPSNPAQQNQPATNNGNLNNSNGANKPVQQNNPVANNGTGNNTNTRSATGQNQTNGVNTKNTRQTQQNGNNKRTPPMQTQPVDPYAITRK